MCVSEVAFVCGMGSVTIEVINSEITNQFTELYILFQPQKKSRI